MDLLKKLENAETTSDQIAALMVFAKLAPQTSVGDLFPSLAGSVKPQVISALLDEDPAETDGAGIIVLSRLLCTQLSIEGSKFVECVPSLIGCMEKVGCCGSVVEANVCSDSLYCLRKLFNFVDYDRKLFDRTANVLVKYYPHYREKVIEVAIELSLSRPEAGVLFSKVAALAKDAPEAHVLVVVALSNTDRSMLWRQKSGEVPWLKHVYYILNCLMRGRLRDELRWQTVVCIELLVRMFRKEVLMKELQFFITAFCFASLELEFLINLGLFRRNFEQIMAPTFSCFVLLIEAPEMLSVLLGDDARFNEGHVSALIKQIVSTTNFIFGVIIDDEQGLPQPVLALTVEMLLTYLREASDLLNRALVKAAVPKMFQFWNRACQQSWTTDDFALLTRFMHCINDHAIPCSPENMLEYAEAGLGFYERSDVVGHDEKVAALLNTYGLMVMEFPWEKLASVDQEKAKAVFRRFIKLYEDIERPLNTYCRPLSLLAVFLAIYDQCHFEMELRVWQHVIDDIALCGLFVGTVLDPNDSSDPAIETAGILSEAVCRLSLIISKDAHLKDSLRSMWLAAFPSDDLTDDTFPVTALIELRNVFVRNST